MANIANVKVKAGNVLELSGSSVSISGSGGLALHTQNGGIAADAGTGAITLTGSSIQLTGSTAIKGNLVVSGNIEAHRLDIIVVENIVSSSVITREGNTRFGDTVGGFGVGDLHEFSGSVRITNELSASSLTGSGGGLTNIPNAALTFSSIGINGTEISLGQDVTTVAASDGLTSSTNLGTVTLQVSASGNDSGLVVDPTGVKVDNNTVARLNANANFGNFNVSASYVSASSGFVGDGSALTNLTADNLAGTIPAAVLNKSTIYIGTTGIKLDRSSAALTLEDVSVSGSFMSASVEVKGTAAEFGTLALTNDLAVTHGGTGISTAPSAGQLLMGSTTTGQYVVGELTSSDGSVTFNSATNGKLNLTVDVGAVGAVTLGSAQDITGAKTFNTITVSGSSGLTLTSDAPLVASGSVTIRQSLDLEGILNVAAAATGSVTNAHSVVLAADNSEVELPVVDNGRLLIVKKSNSGTSDKGVLVKANGAQLIDGASTFGLFGPYQSITLLGSGSSWYVL